MAEAEKMNCMSFSPVDNLTITVRLDLASSPKQQYDVEWCDVRCLPSSSDADVSRNVTPRAFNETARTAVGLIRTLSRITFGDQEEGKHGRASSSWLARPEAAVSGADYVFFLQKRANRAHVKRISLFFDGHGELHRAAIQGQRDIIHDSIAVLKALQDFCSPEQGYVMMRPVAWAELPSELWWHVLRCLTRNDGRAVPCSCKLIRQVVTSPNFIWAPSKLHLALEHAQEAVR